jgi:hydrogenase nickel incorporation protein HypA/HybF
MHELGIAQSLLEIVEQEARPYEGARVLRIQLRIGKLSTVVPDALRFAFDAITRGGMAEGAALEIVEDPFMICPHCGAADVEMVSGRELEIRSMEICDGD